MQLMSMHLFICILFHSRILALLIELCLSFQADSLTVLLVALFEPPSLVD
jgi:hypothetical protein